MTSEYKILLEKSEKENLENYIVDGESCIKISFKVVLFDDINRIHPAQDRV
jgi:hypothetical protein